MTEIQRYEVTSHPETRQPEMVPSPNPLGGGYVRYSDLQAELDEIAASLQAESDENFKRAEHLQGELERVEGERDGFAEWGRANAQEAATIRGLLRAAESRFEALRAGVEAKRIEFREAAEKAQAEKDQTGVGRAAAFFVAAESLRGLDQKERAK